MHQEALLAMAMAQTMVLDREGDVDTVAYRGPDRRRASSSTPATSQPVAFGAFLVGSHVVLALTVLLGSWSATGTPGETDWLTPSVAVISALAAGVSAVRWRLVGDAGALWLAAALFVYAAANIAFPDLLRSFTGPDDDFGPAAVLRPASVIVVMGLLVITAASPRVDAALTIRRVVTWTAGLAAIGVVAAIASADVRLVFGPALDEVPAEMATGLGQIGVGIVWLTLAVGFLVRAKRDLTGIDAWLALMLLGLAEARLALAVSVHGDPAWLLASQVGRLLGVVAMLAGAMHELERAFVRQRHTLLSTDAALTSVRARHEAAVASAQERAHDLRSALAGIGSAAVTLERHHDHLSTEERSGLARAVAAEIERLQMIVANARADLDIVDVEDVVEPLVRCARAQGTTIEVDIDPGLRIHARGAEIAEAVQNLLDNARRHAPGTPVRLRARRADDHVQLLVEDRGPGLDPAIRSRIFERGVHGGAAGSSGLGLHVAARLVRASGGTICATNRPGGGASFSISLPTERAEEAR